MSETVIFLKQCTQGNVIVQMMVNGQPNTQAPSMALLAYMLIDAGNYLQLCNGKELINTFVYVGLVF